MRDRIWTELTQAKYNAEFAALYADSQRKLIRRFNIFVLTFSTGGVLGWKFFDTIPLIACSLICAVSLIRHLQPQLIMTDKQILNLDNINKFYINYYNKLERLWYDFEHSTNNLDITKNSFFAIKETESEINTLVNETIRTKPQKLVDLAKCYSDQYFLQTFNTKTNG